MIISLRQWIEGVKGDDSGSSTDHKTFQTYISSAIRIAICLLEPIASAEERGAVVRLPPVGVDWAEKGTVELKNGPDVRQLPDSDQFSEGAFDTDRELDEDELLAHLDAIGQEGGFDLNQKSAGSENISHDDLLRMMGEIGDDDRLDIRHMNNSSFYNVLSANLVADHVNVNNNDHGDKLRQIYSLGLVFYELFSKGDMSTEKMPAAASGSNESSPINFARGLDLNSGSRECDSENKKGKMIAASTLPLENLRSKQHD
jgi:hypothetical protein